MKRRLLLRLRNNPLQALAVMACVQGNEGRPGLRQTSGMSDVDPAPLLVACLCAAWCRTCGEYRSTFDTLQAEFGASAHFVWVDIEDDEDALGDVDVVDFPTLLLAHGKAIDFYGPVLPNPQAARQLIERALIGQLRAVLDPSLAGLPVRIAALR